MLYFCSEAQTVTGVNQTLYVNNLNDKIHPDTLSKNLREVFGAFGEIQDLICMKSPGGASFLLLRFRVPPS